MLTITRMPEPIPDREDVLSIEEMQQQLGHRMTIDEFNQLTDTEIDQLSPAETDYLIALISTFKA